MTILQKLPHYLNAHVISIPNHYTQGSRKVYILNYTVKLLVKRKFDQISIVDKKTTPLTMR